MIALTATTQHPPPHPTERATVNTLLKHPESVQYREITQPQQGYTTEITGGLLMREKREYGWTVKVTINAKDSRDRYVGFKTYVPVPWREDRRCPLAFARG
jgi:hypothetical protein